MFRPAPNGTPAPPLDAEAVPQAEPGEAFDMAAASSRPRHLAGWFLVVLVASYCLYTAGALVQRNSSAVPAMRAPAQGLTTLPPIQVDVIGAVRHPGVYTLPYNARVLDVLHKAGGPLPDADTTALNLAAWVNDGAQVVVPLRGRPHAANISQKLPSAPGVIVPGLPPLPQELPPTKVIRVAPKQSRSAKGKSKEAPSPVSINQATLAELETLPGVGPKMAQKIVDFRTAHGAFATIDALDGVPGIGPKKLAKMRPYLLP